MKKRVLSILLCLVLVLGIVPTSTFAEVAASGKHSSHCVCGKTNCRGEGHNPNTTWKAITLMSDISKDGNYYLTSNVQLNTLAWICNYNVNLCLNGKTLTNKNKSDTDNYAVIKVASGKSLSITDCHSGDAVGKITHAEDGKGGCGIENLGTLILWNGNITGNGLSIKNNGDPGGGVINSGTFTMNGGSITGNTAQGTDGSWRNGGGVHNKGTFTMNAGTISGNKCSYGGGVYNYNTSYNSTFAMNGGSITGNTASGAGGGVYNSSGTFTMSGGSITDNTCNSSYYGGGGVYNESAFNLSGNVKITDNKIGGTFDENGTLTGGETNNVYISYDYYGNNRPIESTGLGSGASVGINGMEDQTVVTGTTNAKGFFSDNTTYALVDNGKNGLMLSSVHSDHHICGDSDCADAKHGDTLKWKGIKSLREITKAGNYYLKQNVTLDGTWSCTYSGVNLCLNGKTITGKGGTWGIAIRNEKSLSITDCQTTAGKITHKSGESGMGIWNGGTLNLWNGTISGNTGEKGAGVYNYQSTFNMYGGSITNNNAEYGGGVYTWGSLVKFNMYGGKIADNTATKIGGGVYNYYSIINMHGGCISGNKGGTYGGGIYNCEDEGVFNMSGGNISGNSADFGGGVHNIGIYNISGGSITGNTAAKSGAGMYTSGTINMSGAPNITGNKLGGKITNGTITGGKNENVYLTDNKAIAVTDTMDESASVGITGKSGSTVVTGTTSPTGFFCDNTDYCLKEDGNGGLKLSRDATISGKLLVKAGSAELAYGKKTYDGEAVVFDDVIVKAGGNTVEGATYTYTWQEKLANGTYNTLTSLTGPTGPLDAGDYKLTVTATKNNEELASATWTFTIEKAKLTVTFDVEDKVYDGTTNATVKIKDVIGISGNSEFTISMWNENFADANVGRDITVTANLKITGDASKNYTVPSTLEGKANITSRPLTVNVTAQDKEYDGTADATVKAMLDMNSVVKNDEVTLITDGVTAAFNTKDFGTNKPVTLTGKYTLKGAAAGNYTLTLSANLTANINKKKLTIENLMVSDKIYDGTDKAVISGIPTLRGVVKNEDVTLVNGTPSFTGVTTGDNILISFTAFSLSGTDMDNYTLVQPSDIMANIKPYISVGSEYKVNSNDWLNTDFTVTAQNGWLLSYTNTAQSEWVDVLSASQETGNGALHFYVKNKESGIISEEITENYKIDKTMPTGKISIDELNAWQKFLNVISFNLFYKNEQTVTVTADDNDSGVKIIEYFMTADDLIIDQLANKTFTKYKKPFGINPDAKLIIYAKLTDTAGNVDYLRSDGIVLDATAPVIGGADNGKTYCSSVTLTITDEYLDTVTLNDKSATLTNGKLTLGPAAGKQTVVATDKAGNSTTIAVTVNNSHTWCDWTSNSDNTHTRVCKFDRTHTDKAECQGGTATCQVKAICDDCHQSYGDYGEHDWNTTAWNYKDADGHAHTCRTAGCAKHNTVATHTKDRDAATEDKPIKCTECGYIIAPALGHVCANHLTPVEAKAATCTVAGNKAYYECSCGKLFEDATANIEITDHDSVVINALDHDWKAATCTEPKTCKRNGCNTTEGTALGHNYSADWSHDKSGHWHACKNEGCTDKADFAKHTPSAAATETVAQTCTKCGYVIAPALGHICANHLNKIDSKAATTTSEGNIEYWYCDGCGKYYSDKDGTKEIKSADTVIAKLAPSIIAGNKATVTKGKESTLSFASNAAFEDFIRVEVDGKTVDESNYTVKSGSTIVTLNANYIATLSAGEHTLGIVSQSGTATAKFTINKKAANATTTTDKTAAGNSSPKTGDSSMMSLWIALLFVSGAGTAVYSKKKIIAK